MYFRHWVGLLLTLVFSVMGQAQQEHITDYDVKIEVRENRSILVTERIRVYANGQRKRRGITRNLPTRRDIKGKSTQIHYHIQSVKMDGKRVPYFSQSNGSDKVLYIGDKDRFLRPGYYDYTIKYVARNQVVLFEEYDEIYWNAIGTSVQFDILKASAEVILPEGATILQEQAYVGKFGSQSKDYTKSISDSGSTIKYIASRQLAPREGMTIAVAMPKGIMKEPNFLERLGTLMVLLIGSVMLIIYYLLTWMRHGVDPPIPTPFPLFFPPREYSAGALNYLHKARTDSRALTASIVQLAIKGYLRIEEEKSRSWVSGNKKFALQKLKNEDNNLPDEQNRFMETLFGKSNRVELYGEYNFRVDGARSAHSMSLSAQYGAFLREGNNLKFLGWPILIIIASLGLSVVVMNWLSVNPSSQVIYVAASIPVMIVSLMIYGYLIRKPTRERQQIKSEIQGFKMYLEMAEKDRIKMLNPPDMTPEHFEELLPYAFALGIEHKWSEKFTKILEAAKYEPKWSNAPVHRGLYFHSALRSGMSSVATKPSSDGSGGGWSGSGGGGSSGGGGGGGGVGGW